MFHTYYSRLRCRVDQDGIVTPKSEGSFCSGFLKVKKKKTKKVVVVMYFFFSLSIVQGRRPRLLLGRDSETQESDPYQGVPRSNEHTLAWRQELGVRLVFPIAGQRLDGAKHPGRPSHLRVIGSSSVMLLA